MELLTVENLNFTYPLCDCPALSDISFSLQRGDFAVLCGATGSGKSTLLRMLKRELTPLGEKKGRILFRGTELGTLDPKISASAVGFVMQKPEQQIVTDKVWHELAFGLENLNTPQPVIARRAAEMASYFGMESWYDRAVSDLSGGQKQLLNLASVMVMNPEILILDEPTSQLDPIAASDFISTIKKLNEDFSLTVIIVEHRLEELIPICSRLLVMEEGRLIRCGSPREVIASLDDNDDLLAAMPTAARMYHTLGCKDACPLTVREGRAYIEEHYDNRIRSLGKTSYTHHAAPALEFSDVFFRYTRTAPDVLCGLRFTVYENEIYSILGGNGSGKTTSLMAAAGFLHPYGGYIRIFGKKQREYRNQSLYRDCLALLPQDVQTVFLKNTVREELEDAGADLRALPFDIGYMLDRHPYDLSGGEQQLAALAKVLAANPRLLLMDEPTKGLDAQKKNRMAEILKVLQARGVTIVLVTHDVEFSAMCADRCALFFRGNIVSEETPQHFFSENQFYTTAASRMSQSYYDDAVTVDDVVRLCRMNTRENGGIPC
ncbi:MAG: ABC transporter ATP-binding protein [Eubacteriales bacterium]